MMRSLLVSAAAAASALAADITVIQSSASGDTWAPQPGLSWSADFPSPIDVTVDYSKRAQTMMGFGAAFTDTSAYNAMVLMNSTIQAQLLESLWGASGLGWSIGRVTLNSADYSFQSFNYDNVTDDFNLLNFDHTLAYDHQRVIPLIIKAKAVLEASWGQKENSSLRLFASPWSPPGWMKTNGNMIDSDLPCLKNDTAAGQSYKQSWADYILAWLVGYEAAGLPAWGLTPQNEPMAQQPIFESCAYTLDGMAEFIGRYLGPTVKAKYPNINIMAYDHNKIDAAQWGPTLLQDPVAGQYLSGTAVHWYDYETSLALDSLTAIAAAAPSKFMLNTEACFLSALVYDWSIGELYAADIIGGINFGLSGWLAWNSVLLTGSMYPQWLGGPNHDGTRNFGDPVLFQYNADGSQQLLFQSSYWILGHVSRFARPGSSRVATAGAGVAASSADYDAVRAVALGKGSNATLPLMATAFLTADGTTVNVVVANPRNESQSFKLRDGTSGTPRAAATTIPAHAIQTYSFTVA